jgi:hypothetical protein
MISQDPGKSTATKEGRLLSPENSSRREFLQLAAASVTTLAESVMAQTSSASATGMPTRILGRTGVRVCILGVGGAHAGRIPGAEGERFVHMAVDEGITFFDNAWDYNGGTAEEVMGRNLASDGYGNKVFLRTKNCGRDYKHSMKCLDDSLRRLRTDHLDLWQFHEINYDNDPDWLVEHGALILAGDPRSHTHNQRQYANRKQVLHFWLLGTPLSQQ